MKIILVLEDNDDRIAAFHKVVATLGSDLELKVWHDAHSMMAECEAFFGSAILISLDHDLNPRPGTSADPGDGLEVARFLGDYLPVCPVLIHSSNTDRAWSMHNELRFTGWTVDRVGPLGTDWIETAWLKRARELLSEHTNTWQSKLADDHPARIERMKLSLDGLGLGDALGEMLSYRSEEAPRRLGKNELPGGPWFHTDDTEMAISICAVLKSYGFVHQDALARRFARRFERDPDRGYGSMTRMQMQQIIAGAQWRETAANAFGGQGSMGNGGAMRVAPLGAFFADNVEHCAEEARASALVTHTHPEGVAGAMAGAVGAAMAWRLRGDTNFHELLPEERERQKDFGTNKGGTEGREKAQESQNWEEEFSRHFFSEILRLTPESRVRRGILIASQTPPEVPARDIARALGNGSLVTAPDTVPFCLWMAARHSDNFVEALGQTIQCGGDCDTNAAIVGGIVAPSAGRKAIPDDWFKAMEAVRI